MATTILACTPTLDTGNTAWMMMSTILVLLMSIPGIALFYGGLVRQKNVLSIVMQTMLIVGAVSILWVAFGYSWAFDTSYEAEGSALAGIIGGWDKAFLHGITTKSLMPSGIPEITFVMFQCMFALITPALILGAFAERIKFKGYMVFTLLWVIIAYFPMAHWVWGGGFLQQMGAIAIGIITPIICFFMVAVVKARFKYDDALDAFGVHGVGGIVGSVLTGVFATQAITGEGGVQGSLYGDWHQLWVQLIATVFCIVFSAIVTAVLFFLVDKTVGIRVDKRVEEEGLDIYEHGESAYN